MAYLNWRAEGDNQDDQAPSEHTGGVSPVGTFFIVLFVLLVVAALGWVAFTQLRARRLGVSFLLSSLLPPSSRDPPSLCTSRAPFQRLRAPPCPPTPGLTRTSTLTRDIIKTAPRTVLDLLHPLLLELEFLSIQRAGARGGRHPRLVQRQAPRLRAPGPGRGLGHTGRRRGRRPLRLQRRRLRTGRGPGAEEYEPCLLRPRRRRR